MFRFQLTICSSQIMCFLERWHIFLDILAGKIQDKNCTPLLTWECINSKNEVSMSHIFSKVLVFFIDLQSHRSVNFLGIILQWQVQYQHNYIKVQMWQRVHVIKNYIGSSEEQAHKIILCHAKKFFIVFQNFTQPSLHYHLNNLNSVETLLGYKIKSHKKVNLENTN